jgi:flagellar motor switch protein FliN/FliY
MLDRRPETVAQVIEACETHAVEISAAIARALDCQVTVAIGTGGKIDMRALPESYSAPGLAIVLANGEEAALLVIPEGSGFVPAWCAEPDAAGQSRLATLAQEVGMLVTPEGYTPTYFKAGFVTSLAAAVVRGGVLTGAVSLPLSLGQPDGQTVEAALVWPVPKPASVFGTASRPDKGSGAGSRPRPGPATSADAASDSPATPEGPRVSVASLPVYARSLLRVRVPVIVTLAEKKQALRRILELAPGSIIQFDKACEEMLELAVGQRPVALGEAVKVGDKFGLRVTSVILPEERFQPVQPGMPG